MKFNAKKTCENLIEFIRNYFKKHHLKGAVVGISGGKDSGVVAGLMTRAIGAENIVGVKMPCHSDSIDGKLAEVVANHFGFKLYSADLTKTFDELSGSVKEGFGKVDESLLTNSAINLKPRLRMCTLYYYSAMLSAVCGGTYIVVGTGNKCELFVGYFTKGGDGVSDLSPLADLTVSEVIAVGEVLGVPPEVLYRTPSDGLSTLSDEEKMGVTYADIEKFISDSKSVDDKVAKKIRAMHKNTRHKFKTNFYKKV